MLEVLTGSRLHFGLLELAAGEPNRFGGLGLMLDAPGWKLVFGTDQANRKNSAHSNSPATSAEVRRRIEQVRGKFAQYFPEARSIPVAVEHELPLHSGLGAGTQLAAAVAFGFQHYLACLQENAQTASGTFDSARVSLDELILFSGRGKRSGIGLAGFQYGGLIFDEGYPAQSQRDNPNESPTSDDALQPYFAKLAATTEIVSARAARQGVRPLVAKSCAVNSAWRVVLITPSGSPSIAGGYETSLMECAGEEPNPNKGLMLKLAVAAQAHCRAEHGFEDFVQTLEQYLQHAANLFVVCQGGVYNGEAVRAAAESAMAAGLRGVGQSSWGPTVFGFAPSDMKAQESVAKLRSLAESEPWNMRVATPAASGAQWHWKGS